MTETSNLYKTDTTKLYKCIKLLNYTVRPWEARFLGNEKTRAAQIIATFGT